jgi:PHD/YefM family antitoxin component YafN of YafNO toxin-antitoxin module
MRTIELSTATGSLAEYAHDLDDEVVVLTENSEPVAAIVSLKHVDSESLALSTNPELLAIIEQARQEIAAGQSMSLDEMRRAVLS